MLVEVFLKNVIHSKQCSCISTTAASTVSSYITSKYFFMSRETGISLLLKEQYLPVRMAMGERINL